MEEQKVETQTPELTIEEQIQQLTASLEVEKQARLKLEEDRKSANKLLGKKDYEIQQLRAEADQGKALQRISEAALAVLAKKTGQSIEEVEEGLREKQPDLLAEIEKAKQEVTQQQFIRNVEQVQKRVESLGIKPDDDEYEVVKELALAGKFDLANKRLEKFESSKEVKKEPGKKVEESKLELDEETKENIYQEGLKKHGFLKSGAVKPSGSMKSAEAERKQIRDDFIKNPYSKKNQEAYNSEIRQRR